MIQPVNYKMVHFVCIHKSSTNNYLRGSTTTCSIYLLESTNNLSMIFLVYVLVFLALASGTNSLVVPSNITRVE